MTKYFVKLRHKLVEEAIEYLQNPSIDELADILTVIETLAKYDLKRAPMDIGLVTMRKTKELGAFNNGLGMYTHSTIV